MNEQREAMRNGSMKSSPTLYWNAESVRAPLSCSLKPKYKYDSSGSKKKRVTAEANVCLDISLLRGDEGKLYIIHNQEQYRQKTATV